MTTRKHVFYGILALVSLLGLGITQSARANLITNGGFETGDFTGWTPSALISVQGTFLGVPPHSGNFQAFSNTGLQIVTQNLTTTPGASYVLGFWLARADSGPGLNSIAVNWGGSTVFSHVFPSGSFGYTEFTFTVNASSPTTALQFRLFDTVCSSNFFFLDDVSVNPAGVPDAGSTLPCSVSLCSAWRCSGVNCAAKVLVVS